MTVKKANKLLRKWTKKLGIEDWTILLKINQSNETMEENCGDIDLCFQNKSAVIRILDEKEYDKGIIESFNFEKTLVHELLHIRWATFQPDVESLEYKFFHQALNDMAKLLVGYENKSDWFKNRRCYDDKRIKTISQWL
jgi:hypothetical protein